jgi:zinc transport system substrate-binding protein
MKSMKTVLILLAVLLGTFVFILLRSKPQIMDQQDSKPVVALSTFALYDVAKNIAGDTIECFSILPNGVDVHTFEPTPKIMAKVYDAKLIVFNGAGLQPWTHLFEDQRNGLNMSRYIQLKEVDSEDDEHHGDEGNNDPHYWLDIDNMIIAANVLKDQFIKLLPQNRDLYEQNAMEYITKLKELDRVYRENLSTCKVDTIVVEHNAFSYLADKYGFGVESISGLSPDAQPSAQVMGDIIRVVKNEKIKTIFFESFASDKVAKAIASDAHVKTDTLQPIENITADEAKKGATYNSLMMENLAKIVQARECR